MRKSPNSTSKATFCPSRATKTLFAIGIPVVALPLFYLMLELTAKQTLTVYECKLYAAALEHILAGLTLLTGGTYLVERVCRARQKEK
ncbi:MAG: hypothetical protein J6U87_00835 [Clostridia bacterium]|nr:hypothetical protein [Clostridia bacterium]